MDKQSCEPRCVKLILQSGPFEKGQRYRCEQCGSSYRMTPMEVGFHFGLDNQAKQAETQTKERQCEK